MKTSTTFAIWLLPAYKKLPELAVLRWIGSYIRTYSKMSHSTCSLSRKVEVETVRNCASSDMVTLT